MAAERIICLQLGSHLRDCPLMKNSGNCVLDYGCDQLEGVKCNKGLPRTEAIERMAKAIWKSDNKDLPISYWEKQMKEAKERYLRRAEAALDALIGD